MTERKRSGALESNTCPENSLLTKFFASKRDALGLIVLVGIIVYSNTFYSPFVFDDLSSIVDNSEIKNLSSFLDAASLLKGRYLGRLSFALNYDLNGLNTFGYHVVNLVIHLLSAILVYYLVTLTARTSLFKSSEDAPSRSVFQVIALFAALLFVAHPIQTQAITYIVQRYASLATLFYLLSIVAYIKWRLTSNLSERTKIPWFLISFLAAVAAMESKEIAFTLPLMIVLYEFTFFRGPVLKRLGYLSLIAATSLIIPFHVIMARLVSSPILLTLGGVLTENSRSPRDLYLYSQFGVITTYIRLIFLPINQTLDYYDVQYCAKKFLEFGVIAPLLLLLSIIVLALYLHVRGMRRKQPLLCLIAFGIYWFFIALSVESSVIPISDLIFEHRVYLPSVGAFIAIAAGSILLLGRLSRRRAAFRHAVPVIIVISITAYSMATLARNAVWKDEISLNRDNVKKSPLRGRAHNNLGYAYFKQRQYELAEHEYSTAINLDPEVVPAGVYYNLGLTLLKLHRLDEAIAAFENASKKEPKNELFHKYIAGAVAERDRLKQYFTNAGAKRDRWKQ